MSRSHADQARSRGDRERRGAMLSQENTTEERTSSASGWTGPQHRTTEAAPAPEVGGTIGSLYGAPLQKKQQKKKTLIFAFVYK